MALIATSAGDELQGNTHAGAAPPPVPVGHRSHVDDYRSPTIGVGVQPYGCIDFTLACGGCAVALIPLVMFPMYVFAWFVWCLNVNTHCDQPLESHLLNAPVVQLIVTARVSTKCVLRLLLFGYSLVRFYWADPKLAE